MAQGVASAPAPQHSYREQGGPSDQGLPQRREPHRHTYGAIDLGTNNCRLLIARPERGRLRRHRRIFAHRPARRGAGAYRRAVEEAMDRAVAALTICADKLRRRNVSLARSVATEACRRACNGARVHRTGPRRDRDRARHHRAGRRSAAGGARLPQAARAGRRPGADLRHRRRIDRAGPDRPGGRQPRIRAWWSAPWGVVSLTESEGKEALEGPRPPARLRAHARARAPRLRQFRDACSANRATESACSAPAAR